ARDEVRPRAEARDRDVLALQVRRLRDRRRRDEGVNEFIDQRGDHLEMKPGQVRADDFARRAAAELDLAGDHALHDRRTAGNVDDLGVEAVLLEQAELFREMMHLLARADSAVAENDALLRRRRDGDQEKCDEQESQKFLLHQNSWRRYFTGGMLNCTPS